MIAGLLTPDRGRIVLDDEVLFDAAARIDVPAWRRRIGYVFQEGRLFPHLSVAAQSRLRPLDERPRRRSGEHSRMWSNCSTSAICSTAGPASCPAASASASRSAARC